MSALLGLSSTACFYPAERGKLLEARVDRLTADNAASQEKLEKTLPKVDAKLGEVGKTLEALDKASKRSGADIGVQLQKTVEDVAQLRGQVETYLHRISDLEGQLHSLQDDNQKKWNDLKGSESAKEAEAKKKSQELERPADKRAFLNLCAQKAEDKDYPLARQLYGEWLKKWPKDELTGEAHFGLGQCYAAEGRCREALFEYSKVLQDFTKSKSAPNAYLKSAECFMELKMLPEAKLALEELVRSHPKSEPAKAAKERLAQLDKANKKQPKKK